MTRSIFPFASLAVAVTFGAALACGGGDGPQGPGPQVPSATPTDTATPPAASSAAPAGTAANPHGEKGPMKDVAPSAMGEELKAIGLDPANLPALNKMEPDKLRKVMKLFAKSLGVQCTGCHAGTDFRAPTEHKKIAAKMWEKWVVGLSFETGAPVFCDSCHQGHMEFLDRGDKKALSGWMEKNFVSKLKRKDAKDHGCETCHGDPFENKFVDAWGK